MHFGSEHAINFKKKIVRAKRQVVYIRRTRIMTITRINIECAKFQSNKFLDGTHNYRMLFRVCNMFHHINHTISVYAWICCWYFLCRMKINSDQTKIIIVPCWTVFPVFFIEFIWTNFIQWRGTKNTPRATESIWKFTHFSSREKTNICQHTHTSHVLDYLLVWYSITRYIQFTAARTSTFFFV